MSVHDQPVASVQWLPRERLRANDYNPNVVAPPELRLLKLSIIENGWTQPIVARPVEDDMFEVVDGFHRWTVAGDPDIGSMTDGLVPVVVITPDPATQRMATIRHNRARGTHTVVRMADIVNVLVNDMGLSHAEVGARLQMDTEEVKRLLQYGDMRQRGHSSGEFSKGWVPGTGAVDAAEDPEAIEA